MKQIYLAIALALVAGTAFAGNDNANPCGNNGNNCQPSAPTYNDATANAGAIGVGVGLGVGVGYAEGGNANATGGNASAIGTGGAGGSVGDIRNTNSATGGSVLGSGNSTNTNVNTALGGAGGSAVQGQQQGQGQLQGQQQSNVGINGQQQGQSTDVATSTSTAQGQSQDASSQNANDNRSSASGNATSVGGQSVSFSSTYVAKRNAPGAYAPSVYPTATCQKSVSLGLSGLWGGGAVGGSYSDKECQTVVLAQNLASIGMTDTACDVLKTSETWKRAAAANPELASVSCKIAQPAAAAQPPVIEYNQPQTPRGSVEPTSKWKHHTVIENGKKI